MGTMVQARCGSCALDEVVAVGIGMLQRTAIWPACCPSCRTLQVVDTGRPTLRCPACRSRRIRLVSDPSIWQGDGEPVERSDDLVLTNGHYRCPACEKPDLRFDTSRIGCWD